MSIPTPNINAEKIKGNLSINSVSASTYYNLPTDIYVTGGTYSSGVITFTNSIGGTFTVTGLTSGGGGNFTGGTVVGTTYFLNGLSANTISATTYYGDGSNLTGLSDYYVTGGTYSNGTLTLNRQNGSVTITGFTSLSLSATSLNVNYIDFNTGATVSQYPGRINWDAGTGTLNVNVGDSGTGLIDLQVGQEEIVRVYNSEATTLVKGEIVYVSGSQGNRPAVKRASAVSDGYSVTTLGMVDRDISSGSEGYVTTFGIISNLNTLGLTGGTPIWLSPTTPGAYTSTKPIAPYHTVLIGYVVRVSATVGSIFVNISNGWELDEIHDVRISGATEGDLLVRSSYNGSNVWVNSKTLNGSYKINGGLNVTGTTSASTYSITSTPSTNTSETDVLVRNTTTGNIEKRSINSLINTNNTVTVALTGSTGVDFNSIKSAVESITGATSANTYTVHVSGGVYNENPFRIPSWVSVVGESSISTIINANDPSQTLINLSDQSALFDCQVQGCTNTNVSAIVYSSSTTPQSSAISYVENVRFGSNYTHAKVVASGGANIIMQCSNVKYGGYPFTVGFYTTNDGSGIGRMQLRNVTSTNGGIVTTTGLIFAKADAASCGFIVNGCLLTKAAGAAAGTGFYVENGGFLRLTAVNFQRWDVGIDAPQIGSAPSIDAIALNFENNNTDVNIAHSGATGKIQGTDNFLKTKININAPLYEVNQDPRQITVSKKGGDFSSIKSAVDYLASSGNTSSSNRYIISVGPGVFIEGEIDLTNTPYVSIVGSNIQTTQVVPSSNTQHIIKIGQNNEISFLSLSGAASGYAGIYCYDIGDFGQAHKVSFYDCDTNVWVESSTQDTKFYGEYLDFNGEYTYGTKVVGNNNYLALANIENYYNFPTGSNITYCNYATGSGATLSVFVGDNVSNDISGSTAFYIQDGAELNASTITVDGFTYGIRNPNVGNPIRFDVDNSSMVNGEWDLYVERVGTFGTFGGSSSHEKIYTLSSDVYWLFLDIDDGELDLTRKASVTFADGTHTDLTTLVFKGSTMGLISGGEITTVSGFTVSTAAGFGYLEKTLSPDVVMRIDWSNSQITLGANENKYIYINENSILSSSGTRPSSVNNIILGRVVTNSTTVEFIDLSPTHSDHTSNRFGNLFREAMGPIYAFGSIVTENVIPFRLDVTSGEYYYSTSEYVPSGGTAVSFTQYYRDGSGGWITTATTVVNNTSYDGNGSLSALTTGYYTKHTLYVVGDGSYEKYFLVLGQNEYSTLVQAEDALLPTPPSFFSDSVSQIASVYIKQGTTGITQIEDIRPTIGFRAGGVNASSVHGNLLGLGADDHTQYLLGSGARSMTGNLNMGGNEITNVGNVDGVDISSHATRHQFGGADPVGTVTPSPNAIPYADVNGSLDSWVSTASTTTIGRVRLSTTPVSSSDPLVVGDNDVRVTNAVSGGTYNQSTGTITLNRNNGTSVSLTGFTDYYVTGGTYSNGILTLNRQNGSVTVTGLLSADTFVTGFTYSNNNLTISQNQGRNSLSVDISIMTGLTVNGNLNVNTTTGVNWFSGATSTDLVRITQSGSGNAFVVEDSVNPDSTPFVVTKDGRVGVGISTPFYNVDITDVDPQFRISASTNNRAFRLYPGSGTIEADNTSFYLNRVSNTNILLGFGGGNTGVGSISSPNAKLHVNNTGTSNSFLVEDSTNPDSTPFVIDASGNVGIGTINPTTLLDVSGKTRTTNFQMTSGATSGYVLTSDSSGNALWLPPVVSADTFVTGFAYSNNNLTISQNQGQSPLSVNISIMTGLTINGNLNVNTTNGINWVSGNTSTDLVRITQAGNGRAFVVEDSTNPDFTPFQINNQGQVGIGTNLIISVYKSASTVSAFLEVDNTLGSGLSYGIYQGGPLVSWPSTGIFGNGTTYGGDFNSESTGVKGTASADYGTNTVGGNFTSYAGGGGAVGVYATASGGNSTGLNSSVSGGGIGVVSSVDSGYSIQLLDGTQGVDKVLVSRTSDGKANWSSSLTGLTAIKTGVITVNTTSGINWISGATSTDLVRITQSGSGNAFVVEDSVNPDSSQFVIDNSGNVGIGITTPSYKLDVAGQTRMSGTGQNVLTIIGSGSSTSSPIFSIQGSQGELFSVTDSLTGSLFSVNDISGLPILEVFSDNTILAGSYQAPSLNTTKRLSLTAGTNSVYSIPTSAYTGAFIDYTLMGTGARAGTIMTIWSGNTAQYTDVSTNDIGNTEGVTFSVNVASGLATLSSSATTTGWTLKTIIRSI